LNPRFTDPLLLDESSSQRADEMFEARVPHHQFSIGVVQLFLRLVLSCAVSQRATAAALNVFVHWLPGVEAAPCANSGRMWQLRLGLYELIREKEQVDDWAWIMDHTLQLGPWKCLVIVGVRLSVWRHHGGPLRHTDLQLLNLTPMEQATGERVHQAMVETMAQTGVPRQITSDGGTDLKKGVELLHKDHPQVAHVYDIKHKMALLLRQELEHNEQWTTFVTQSNKTKLGITQTALACLVPPSLKVKARYMNLDLLVEWGRNILRFMDSPPAHSQTTLDLVKLEEKCGWVREYRGALQTWSELLAVAQTAEHYVREKGYHPAAPGVLEQHLAPLTTTAAAKRLCAAVLDFVEHESAATPSDTEQLLGSSEVLESLIGKYKRLQGTHSKGGMTAMLLSFGAIVSDKSHQTIRNALACVQASQVGEWCRKHLGMTLQSQRMLAFAGNNTEIQNIDPEC
jgi:hypothetical protein